MGFQTMSQFLKFCAIYVTTVCIENADVLQKI